MVEDLSSEGSSLSSESDGSSPLPGAGFAFIMAAIEGGRLRPGR